MTGNDLDGRISRLFTRTNARRALFLSGSIAVASCVGYATPDLVAAVHHGLAAALSHVPMAPTLEATNAYFNGGLTWIGAVGVGLSDWVSGAGGEIGVRTAETVNQMRSHLAGDAEAARGLFENTISKSSEFLSFWRSTIRNSIPSSPADLVTQAGKALAAVAEVWGVYKGLTEAYEWSIGKIRRKVAKAPETARTAEAAGISIGSVTNLQVNISVSQGGSAEDAVVKIAKILSVEKERQLHFDVREAPSPQLAAEPAESDVSLDDTASLLDSDSVIWVSREFNETLRRGVMGRLGYQAGAGRASAPGQRLGEAFRPIEGIDGGLILKVTPKGEIRAVTPEYAKMKQVEPERLAHPVM
ncbi:hypothetical protein [Defluviimonas salinarum]|uniref:Uncharacterized protein n=1 Tax=Defluviimonas salinarum TaxID=2992147 RepID=A0ABT3J4D8_9RHOB|nr:hypothetical protein [Defluviimonas salinarum]MCW3782554.1 hypothetical protein [Defluviimonas salinarum]